jgi:transposase
MSALFDERYSYTGRPSIPPEQLLRALLVQILFTIRSDRQLVEQLDYNLLFRWFVGLGMDDAVWDRTVFSINRDRLVDSDVARQFLRRVLHLAEWQGFVSDEHFSVDGTMIEAWASHKSFIPKDGNGPDKPAGRNPELKRTSRARRSATPHTRVRPTRRRGCTRRANSLRRSCATRRTRCRRTATGSSSMWRARRLRGAPSGKRRSG